MRTLLEELEQKKIKTSTYWADDIRVESVTINDLALDLSNDKKLKFWNCNFDNLHLKNDYEVRNLEFYGCTFNNCNFEGVTFSKCDFRHCSWDKGSLKESSFIKLQNFRNCVFNGVDMKEVNFEEIFEMDDNRFHDCNLARANFIKCHIHENWFELNQMINVSFSQCDLTSSSFYQNLNLVKCNFYGSCLNQVQGIALLSIAGHEAILDAKEMQVGCTRLNYEEWEEDRKHRDYLFDTKAEFHAIVALVRANKRVIQQWKHKVKRDRRDRKDIF